MEEELKHKMEYGHTAHNRTVYASPPERYRQEAADSAVLWRIYTSYAQCRLSLL
jgi:hypothetical protein